MSESKTPRTDAEADSPSYYALRADTMTRRNETAVTSVVPTNFARQLETELAAAHEREEGLRAALVAAREFITEMESWCGKNLGVVGWHLNGDMEPLDRIIEDNLPDVEAIDKALAAPSGQRSPWMPIESAPKDGTLILLLIIPCGEVWNPIEDSNLSRTIGYNNLNNDGVDAWLYAGWCWSHDHYVQGSGTPTMWMPLPSAPETIAQEGGE